MIRNDPFKINFQNGNPKKKIEKNSNTGIRRKQTLGHSNKTPGGRKLILVTSEIAFNIVVDEVSIVFER